jgi:hypothetical protein
MRPAVASLTMSGMVKPWACIIASVSPSGLPASNSRARRCWRVTGRFPKSCYPLCNPTRQHGAAQGRGAHDAGRNLRAACEDAPGACEGEKTLDLAQRDLAVQPGRAGGNQASLDGRCPACSSESSFLRMLVRSGPGVSPKLSSPAPNA